MSPTNPLLKNIEIRYEQDLHFIFGRLHPNNIMHNLHDDALGLYFTLKQYVGKGSTKLNMPFSLDHRILVIDDYGHSPTSRVLDYFSAKPLRFFPYLQVDSHITCFRDAVVGLSKTATWYQYGFDSFQGPLKNKIPNGARVREVAEWYLRRNKIIDEELEWNLIVILSRKENRLILNEKELGEHLTKTFGYETVVVSNEEHSFEEQMKILRRARVVLGMHGSILIMGMFCRKGTILLEMYPFAVPAENYTPYRTMANLPGMDLVYRDWVVRHFIPDLIKPNILEPL